MIRDVKRFILSLMLILLCGSGGLAEDFIAVRRVIDGDTIVLENGVHLRYIGINAPEIAHEDKPGEPLGSEALALNEKIVLIKSVRLVADIETTDHYNRRLAYVFLKDGTFVNQEMVRSGLAHVLYKTPNTTHDALLLKTQQEAMDAGKGIWQNWKETPSEYIGNRKSRRFHLTKCPLGHRTSAQNRIRFDRKWNAFRAGYAPCKKCMGQGQVTE
jgi:micrococcal nuclease